MSKKVFTDESWTQFGEGISNLKANIDQKATIIELTQAEYDALGNKVNTDGKTYFIKDSDIDNSVINILNNKMDKENPTGTGSFSMNRPSGSTVGENSFTEGSNCIASGKNSHAGGYRTKASGDYSIAEGYMVSASGDYSYSEGYCTKASSSYQHVQGKCNVEDTENMYAHIVGNGTIKSFDVLDNETISVETNPSNAHTLDWDGNAEFAGDVVANGCGGENPVSLNELNTNINELITKTNVQIVNKAGTNLNDYRTTGIYWFNDTYKPTNIPSTNSAGYLEVIAASTTNVKQKWYRVGTINVNDYNTYVRTYRSSEGWSDWAKVIHAREIQRGSVSITPSAKNTPTSKTVTFPYAFGNEPTVVVTPVCAVPGTVVTGVSVNNVTTTGCTIWLTRTSTTATTVNWIAFGGV